MAHDYFLSFQDMEESLLDASINRPQNQSFGDHYHEQIDGENQTIQIKTNCDSDAPILRLHSEIMVEIFLFAMVGSSDAPRYLRPVKFGWCWLILTHVCRYWRDIAVSTPKLWVHIDTPNHANAEQTAVFIKRSGNAPLYVQCSCFLSPSISIRSLYVALSHIHRIRELRISVQTFTRRMRKLLLQSKAPILEKLSLHDSRRTVFNLRTLFRGHCPRLTSLVINTNSPSWADSPNVQNLTELVGNSKSGNPSMKELISLLQRNPNLEGLRTKISKDTGSETRTRTETLLTLASPIQLRRLKRLRIEIASYKQLLCFFRNVKLPALNEWSIHCTNFPNSRVPRVDPHDIIPSVDASRSEKCTYLDLLMSPEILEILAVSQDTEFLAQCTDWYSGLRQRSLRFSLDKGENPHEEAVTTIQSFNFICSVIDGGFWCSTTKLSVDIEAEVTSFWSGNLGLTSAHWIQLLLMFPHLEDLNVRRSQSLHRIQLVADEYKGFLEALATSSEDREGHISVICPNLSTMQINGINLETGLNNLLGPLKARVSKSKRLYNLKIWKPFGLTDANYRVIKSSGVADNIDIFIRRRDLLSGDIGIIRTG